MVPSNQGLPIVNPRASEEVKRLIPADESQKYLEYSLKGDLGHIESHYLAQEGSHFWCAVDEHDTVVGCVALERKAADHAELRRMYVDPNVRGKGIGKVLLEALKAFAKKSGYERIVLTTSVTVPDTIRFYAKNGFEQTHISLYDGKFEVSNMRLTL